MNMLKQTSDLHPAEEVSRFLIQALKESYQGHLQKQAQNNLFPRLKKYKNVTISYLANRCAFHTIPRKMEIKVGAMRG